jgi:hypothetical protein
MYTLRHVSVPHDFATCARLALDYAGFLGEPVEVLHQWQGPRWGHEDPEPLVLFARSRERREIEECLAALALRCPSRSKRDHAGVCQLTLRVGGTDNYDFIVLGTHAAQPRRTLLLMGQVAKKLAGRGVDLSDERLQLMRVAGQGVQPSKRQLTPTSKMAVPLVQVPVPIVPSDSEPNGS